MPLFSPVQKQDEMDQKKQPPPPLHPPPPPPPPPHQIPSHPHTPHHNHLPDHHLPHYHLVHHHSPTKIIYPTKQHFHNTHKETQIPTPRHMPHHYSPKDNIHNPFHHIIPNRITPHQIHMVISAILGTLDPKGISSDHETSNITSNGTINKDHKDINTTTWSNTINSTTWTNNNASDL